MGNDQRLCGNDEVFAKLARMRSLTHKKVGEPEKFNEVFAEAAQIFQTYDTAVREWKLFRSQSLFSLSTSVERGQNATQVNINN